MSKDAWTLVLAPLLPAMTEGVSLALAFHSVCSMSRDDISMWGVREAGLHRGISGAGKDGGGGGEQFLLITAAWL